MSRLIHQRYINHSLAILIQQQVTSPFNKIEIPKFLSLSVNKSFGIKMIESEIGSVKSVGASSVVVRNVQTQHGDYRSVDEENIVVLPLARCHSPEPIIDENDVIEPVVWIEPFAEENQVSFVTRTHNLIIPWSSQYTFQKLLQNL